MAEDELTEDVYPVGRGSVVLWGPSVEIERKRRRGSNRPHRRLRAEVDAAIGELPEGERSALLRLVAEADLHAYESRRASRNWRRLYFTLGFPAAVLAGVSGGAALASEQLRVSAGVIALLSAGLTAAATFLNSDQRATAEDKLGAAWQELADDARMEVLKVDGADQEPALTRKILLVLQRRKSGLLRRDTDNQDYPEIVG